MAHIVLLRNARISFQLFSRNAALRLAAAAIGCLWFLDVYMTVLMLQTGIVIEANPTAQFLLSSGPWGLIAGKSIGFLMVIWVAQTLNAQGYRKTVFGTLAAILTASLGIVLWNLFSLLVLAGVIPPSFYPS